jgi:ferric-dicitrate binding protein FerR (iron transport regulator)
MNEDFYGSHRQPADKRVGHIRFKPLETDSDRVYRDLLTRLRYASRYGRQGVSPVWKYLSVASAFALLLVSVYALGDRKAEEKPAQAAPPVPRIEISAIPGARARVLLPDSSVAWLNSSATLRYPRQFEGATRTVELEGEGLFEVRKDSMKPFTVSAAGLQVEVTGTVFNVYADSGRCVEVTLVEGSVNLYRDGRSAGVLNANRQALYNRETGEITVAEVNASSYASWVTRRFVFEKATLHGIARELERAFNVKIHIQNDSLKNRRLNARFTHGETLDKILSILQIPAGYTCVKKKGDIYIR